ncbi:hypothetical protein [Streptomyces sp. NPDC059949]|uniref:phage tail protein n=1 Tax=Streptomyces sp. NPDC059949 TaxID=3347013 RepID=UPI003654EEAE
MSAMTIGELVGFIRADNSDFERGLVRSQLQMEGFTLDTEDQLRDLEGNFVDSGQVMERALTGVGNEMEDLSRQTVVYSSVVAAESRTMEARLNRVRDAAQDMGRALGERLGRVRTALSGLSVDTDRLGGIARGFGGIAMSVGGMAAKLGAAVPLVGGLAATVGQIAPAAALAVTALFAVQLATKALKIGMVGVKDAVSAAMDPSDPKAYAEALKKLSPSARAFVGEIRTLQPQLKALQQGVQERLFDGLDGILKGMGKHTLPILKNGLQGAASALNLMGQNIGNTAIGLSTGGVLGKAISGANMGLTNLSRVPAQLLQGLTQVGAAAAPAFSRLTAAAGAGADGLSDTLSRAFESGAITRAIDQAIVVIKQLGAIAGNVFSIFGSIFSAAQASGGGFIGVLQQITSSLATAFASPAVQSGLKAIFETMATLGATIGPLLAQALVTLAPVFTALGPPIQHLIQTLGTALGPIITALGPVLEAAATAVGSLLVAVSPLIPVFASLIVGILPALTPILTMIGNVFKMLAPLIAQVAGVLMSALAPILAALVPVLEPLIAAFMTLVQAILPILSALISAIAPVIAQLAGIFAQLMVALAPVIAQLTLLIASVLTKMMPILMPIIELVAKLAGVFADELGKVIDTVIIPAFEMITNLLSGDFSAAWDSAKQMVKGVLEAWMRMFIELPSKAANALGGLASALWAKVSEAGGKFVDGLKIKLAEAITKLKEVPGMAKSALGDLGSLLWNAGSRLLEGLISGIKSKVGAIKSELGKITGMLPDWKGPASVDSRILRPAGRLLMEGFQRGIADQTPSLQAQLGGLTGALPGMTLGASGTGGMAGAGGGRLIVEVTGPDEVKSFIRRIVQVDGRGSVQTAFG